MGPSLQFLLHSTMLTGRGKTLVRQAHTLCAVSVPTAIVVVEAFAARQFNMQVLRENEVGERKDLAIEALSDSKHPMAV
jgi:hypothetical protein